jgi:hypothetical protein
MTPEPLNAVTSPVASMAYRPPMPMPRMTAKTI